ncbi:hypothetical protein [Paenibacillus amylolyticus]
MITLTNLAFQATGAPDDGQYYIDPETYEASLHYKLPEETRVLPLVAPYV